MPAADDDADPLNAAAVETVLHQEIGGAWTATRAAHGWTGRSFVATDGVRRVFVKLDVWVEALQRLADMEVTPPLIGIGRHDGRTFAIQQFADGGQPARSWFDNHLGVVGELIATYHADEQLNAMLAPAPPPAYSGVIRHTLRDLERRAENAADGPIVRSKLHRAVASLRDLADRLEPAELVPTHGDPNRHNFVLSAEGRPYLVDWDELSLADPLRDIGQLAWWHVTPERWHELFAAASVSSAPGLLERLYWWIAAEFLEVSLTTAAAGYPADAEAFFGDFQAALQRRPNPRR